MENSFGEKEIAEIYQCPAEEQFKLISQSLISLKSDLNDQF